MPERAPERQRQEEIPEPVAVAARPVVEAEVAEELLPGHTAITMEQQEAVKRESREGSE